MRFCAGPTRLVIDELDYLPLPAEAASALFQVVSQRYLKTSIVITTDRDVAGWGESSATRPSPQPCSTGSCTAPLCSTSTATAASPETTTHAQTNSAEPPPAPENRYLDHISQVGSFDEHTWGISMSAITGSKHRHRPASSFHERMATEHRMGQRC
jgi:hypothetical protein